MANKSEQAYIVGVDLGGTNVRACLATSNGKMLAHCKRPTPSADGPDAVIEAIEHCIREVVTSGNATLEHVLGVGVGAPGPLDMDTGVVFAPPNLSDWHNVPLAKSLSARLDTRVKIGNDANLAAIGEHTFGAGRGFDDIVYMTVSTGIGGGVIIGGRLFVGVSGTAGEVGHMTVDLHGPRCKCGNIGCLEVIAAGPAIARAGRQAAQNQPASLLNELAGGQAEKVTTAMVVEAARRHDATALTVLVNAAEAIGAACVNLIHLFNPQRIIIGGGVSNAGDLLLGPIRQIVQDRALETPRSACSVVPAALGDDCGLYGAVALIANGTETLT
ncbi:MAG: ROK family protein [Chloroflexi bacterium]|nr:ROK family protein [Chloroflexota bacterium]